MQKNDTMQKPIQAICWGCEVIYVSCVAASPGLPENRPARTIPDACCGFRR